MNNKKGQIGDLIVSIPVLLLTFVVMAIFVVIVWLFSGLHVVSGADISASSESSLFLQKVNIDGKDKMVFDVILDDKYMFFPDRENFEFALKELLNKEKDCLAILRTGKTSSGDVVLDFNGIFLGRFVNGQKNLFYFSDSNVIYKEKSFDWPDGFQKIYYNSLGKEFYIYSYYGKCKEVENE